MRLLIPDRFTKWQLRADWTIPSPVLASFRNYEFYNCRTIEAWNGDTSVGSQVWVPLYHAWRDQLAAEIPPIPAGTVFQVNRIHMGESDDKTSIQFLGSPDPKLTPRKNGGSGKGKLLLFLKVEHLNDIPEVDLVT